MGLTAGVLTLPIISIIYILYTEHAPPYFLQLWLLLDSGILRMVCTEWIVGKYTKYIVSNVSLLYL